MKDTIDIGIFIRDDDFEYFRRATIGNERRVMEAIAKVTIMEADKLGKMRQIGKKFVIFGPDESLPILYDKMDAKVGKKTRMVLNLVASHRIRNGQGDINAILKEIDRQYENWKANNGSKFNL